MRECVFRIRLGSQHIVMLRPIEIAGVEINRSQVDQRTCGSGVELDRLEIGCYYLLGRSPCSFEIEAALEPMLGSLSLLAFSAQVFLGPEFEEAAKLCRVEIE